MILFRFFNWIFFFIFFCTVNSPQAMWEQDNTKKDPYRYLAQRIIFFTNDGISPPYHTLTTLGFETTSQVKSLDEEVLYQAILEFHDACDLETSKTLLQEALINDKKAGLYDEFISYQVPASGIAYPKPSAPPPEPDHANPSNEPITIESIASKIFWCWHFIGTKLNVDPTPLEQTRRSNLMDTEKAACCLLSNVADTKGIDPEELWELLLPHYNSAKQLASENKTSELYSPY
jgi:hypothetical protein